MLTSTYHIEKAMSILSPLRPALSAASGLHPSALPLGGLKLGCTAAPGPSEPALLSGVGRVRIGHLKWTPAMALAEAAALFGRHVETLRLRIRDADGNRPATHNQEVGIR